eukprot:6419616-Amphidinium_carterae.1
MQARSAQWSTFPRTRQWTGPAHQEGMVSLPCMQVAALKQRCTSSEMCLNTLLAGVNLSCHHDNSVHVAQGHNSVTTSLPDKKTNRRPCSNTARTRELCFDNVFAPL